MDIATNSGLTAAFTSATNGGEASLRITGYRTLDGQNDFEDGFHLSLNGVALIEAAFDQGGGGAKDFSTAVAEPSAWALLIAGFGLAGAEPRGRDGVRIGA